MKISRLRRLVCLLVVLSLCFAGAVPVIPSCTVMRDHQASRVFPFPHKPGRSRMLNPKAAHICIFVGVPPFPAACSGPHSPDLFYLKDMESSRSLQKFFIFLYLSCSSAV